MLSKKLEVNRAHAGGQVCR